MKNWIFLAVFAVAVLFVQPARAALIPGCGEPGYLDANADLIAQGTIARVSYPNTQTYVNIHPVEIIKKNAAPNLVVDQGPGPGLWVWISGNQEMWVEDSPRVSQADVGRKVKVWLRYDETGNKQLVCGELGFKMDQQETVPEMPPLPSVLPYEFTVKLMPGWNLFSTHVYYNGNPVCTGAAPCPLTGIPPMWKIKENTCGDLMVWHYNTNEGKYEDARTLQSMQSSYVNPSAGFWAKSKKSCKIVFEGNMQFENLDDLALPAGWSQIGSGYSAQDAAGMLSSCRVSSGPWYYDNPQGKWVKAEYFKPGQGYFVKLASECQLNAAPAATPQPSVQTPEERRAICLATGGAVYPDCSNGKQCVDMPPACKCPDGSGFQFWGASDITAGCPALNPSATPQEKLCKATGGTWGALYKCAGETKCVGSPSGCTCPAGTEWTSSNGCVTAKTPGVVVKAVVSSSQNSPVDFFATNYGKQSVFYLSACVLPTIQRNAIDGWITLEQRRSVCLAYGVGEIKPGESKKVNSWDRLYSPPYGLNSVDYGYEPLQSAPAASYRYVFSYGVGSQSAAEESGFSQKAYAYFDLK